MGIDESMNTIAEFFSRQTWTFAKTYANRAPHEYIVRGKCNGSDQEFINAVSFIREHALPMKFWGETYQYLHLDGKLYWTIGEPGDETIILNRCNVSDCIITIEPLKSNGNGNMHTIGGAIQNIA